MLENLLAYIKQEDVAEQLYHSLIGIEIEEHRVDADGKLSRHPYPANLGSRKYHPYLQSDFSETMNELITDPNPNIGGVLDQLDTIQTVLYRSMKADDYIWPLSMPPAISADDRNFIAEHFERPPFQKYRDYLTNKYGVPLKIVTGLHVNFSIPEPVINRLYTHYEQQFDSLVAFKNALYFQITQNVILYRWLFTYLFGASPIAEDGFFENGDVPEALATPVRSIRNSVYGYVNQPNDQVNVTLYSSLGNYISRISEAVSTHRLYSPAEFYGPVRLRGQQDLEAYRRRGVSYLEFRVMDNTPFTPNGISRHALYFIKFFLMYLLVKPVDETHIHESLKQAFDDNNRVALEAPDQPTFKQDEGIQIFDELIAMAKQLHAHSEQLQALDDFSEVITHPELTASAMLLPKIKNGSLADFGMTTARKWKKARLNSDQLLPTMANLPENAQQLIFHAIQLGIRYFEIRDENGAELLMFTYDNVTQVVYANKVGNDPLAYLYDLFPEIKDAAAKAW